MPIAVDWDLKQQNLEQIIQIVMSDVCKIGQRTDFNEIASPFWADIYSLANIDEF